MSTIISSRQMTPRHLKLLFWGDIGTRKTESILRYFPNVLLIDTEGNGEQCVGVPEIPEFLLARTKDVNEIIRIVDDVAAGRYKFPDGRPILTVALDSISVLWSIRKDTRALVAEQRNQRWGKTAEEATMTQLDWSMAKRPLIRLNTRLANCPIKYMIYTARAQDKYQEDPRQKDRIFKVGEVPDAIKGLEYDMNLVFKMRNSPEGAWECQVTKVQGALGRDLPNGKVMTAFPADTILSYTGHLSGEGGVLQDETRLAEADAARELPPEISVPSTRALKTSSPDLDDFYAQARELGYETVDGAPDRQRIREVLKNKGYQSFNVAEAPRMLSALREAKDERAGDPIAS